MDLTALADSLRARREELSGELDRITAAPVEGSNVSFGKRIGDGTTEAVERLASTATARSLSTSIRDIDAALAAIEGGTYGRCRGCGRPIPVERLEARPAATHCVDCAAG